MSVPSLSAITRLHRAALSLENGPSTNSLSHVSVGDSCSTSRSHAFQERLGNIGHNYARCIQQLAYLKRINEPVRSDPLAGSNCGITCHASPLFKTIVNGFSAGRPSLVATEGVISTVVLSSVASTANCETRSSASHLYPAAR